MTEVHDPSHRPGTVAARTRPAAAHRRHDPRRSASHTPTPTEAISQKNNVSRCGLTSRNKGTRIASAHGVGREVDPTTMMPNEQTRASAAVTARARETGSRRLLHAR